MTTLNPAEAAAQLGVSAKALRLYEERGLLTPDRTAAGYRAYTRPHMARAAEIAALRALGLSLAQVAQVLQGEAQSLGPALAAHQASIEQRIEQLAAAKARVQALRDGLASGSVPQSAQLQTLLQPAVALAFELPWPWGGERFEIRGVKPITFIIGPLGSGKTRLAQRIAETLPGAAFLGLDRLQDPAPAQTTPGVQRALDWLIGEGATPSAALQALILGLEADGPAALVIDMPEQALDQPTQEALIAHIRRRAAAARPVFLLTRSSAILDLAAVTPHEAIILCPANHSPPSLVAPHPGAPGYESVTTCLASPEVRARTEGMIAWRPKAA